MYVHLYYYQNTMPILQVSDRIISVIGNGLYECKTQLSDFQDYKPNSVSSENQPIVC